MGSVLGSGEFLWEMRRDKKGVVLVSKGQKGV